MGELLEMVIEIVLEVAVEGAKSKRIPKAIRYIFVAIIIAFCLGVMAFLIYLMATMDNGLIVKLIFLGVVVTIGIFIFRLIKEMIERK